MLKISTHVINFRDKQWKISLVFTKSSAEISESNGYLRVQYRKQPFVKLEAVGFTNDTSGWCFLFLDSILHAL